MMIGQLEVKLSDLLRFCEQHQYAFSLSKSLRSNNVANKKSIITGIEPILSSTTTDLTFCRFQNEAADDWITASGAGFVIVSTGYFESPKLKKSTTYIFAEHPRLALLHFIGAFWRPVDTEWVSQTVPIHPSAKIGKNVRIGMFCVIGPGVEIGDDSVIGNNTTIENAKIGKRCHIGNNVAIGGEGFGFEDEEEKVLKFPHLGGVILGEDVRVGSCSCIDRASLGNTIIDDSVKIDNLVHIAHNVTIGRAAKVVAMTIVGGSTKIGENAWIAPGASLRDWINIGDNALVGLGAVVTKDVDANEAVVGNPAKNIRKTMKRYR
ncbi:UDP-3-O-(3-hydroxymyristoyl)glucosamine N-acyltransferase [Alphaproteobacteria bacterium]|nr:UDP-3-O-(3-hydroxymyristoyl)glucosamine N-acyltransferase [Alphaproteobacteria bacterium]MDC1120359.1 UDP-3-O-(3-hydroxymyristoyl)glucosamine N-acyltransferase [Alphaproteobacteria bacterium]